MEPLPLVLSHVYSKQGITAVLLAHTRSNIFVRSLTDVHTYKACIRKNGRFSLQIICKTMQRQQCQQFKGWLVTQGKHTNHMHLVSAFQLVREEFNAERFDVVLSLLEFQELANLYKQYCKDKNEGPLKMFWNLY